MARKSAIRFLVALVLLSPLALGVAAAQDKPVKAHFSGGVALPMGNAGDIADTGWTLSGGADFYPKPGSHISYRVDFGVDWMDLSNKFLSQIDTTPNTPLTIDPPDDGDVAAWRTTGNIVWNSNVSAKTNFYVTAGVGLYYIRANISETGYASGIYCDPWWGWCYPATGTTQYILQDADEWTWGLNAGAGISFKVGPTSELYVEAIYHWADTSNGTAEWIPISIGGRW